MVSSEPFLNSISIPEGWTAPATNSGENEERRRANTTT
jgi:hypothetical protein